MLYHHEILDKIENFLDTSEIIVLHGARQVEKHLLSNFLIILHTIIKIVYELRLKVHFYKKKIF